MADLVFSRALGPLRGRTPVPADKSISHRALILASLADGDTAIENFLESGTTHATLDCLRDLGVLIERPNPGRVVVHGRGLHSLQEPHQVLNCAGSGTTMRLLTGLCAGQPFFSILDGTPALRQRPMARVTEPLRAMRAAITGRDHSRFPPLAISGEFPLRGIEWELPVASAQVKSALLIAGLFADSPTRIREPSPSRDHTERMLRAFGARVRSTPLEASVEPATSMRLPMPCMHVANDFSSAAFLIAAALLVPGSRLTLEGVGLNPTRLGFLQALTSMGAEFELDRIQEENGEPHGDISVSYQEGLRAIAISGDMVPAMIDEFPIMAVVATQAQGETSVTGAAELRVKESDRITSLTEELNKMGAQIEPHDDGFVISGPTRLQGSRVSAHGDHRLAMSLAIAALIAEGDTIIEGWECVSDSFPNFAEVIFELVG